MAGEGLIDFEELRSRLSALEETREAVERELRALKYRTEHLERLSATETDWWRATSVSYPKISMHSGQKNATEGIKCSA